MEIKVFIGNKVDTLTKQYMAENDCADYSIAMRMVLDRDPLLKSQYTEAPLRASPEPSPKVSNYVQKRAGDRVHAMVLDLLAEDETICSYGEGLRVVLRDHPTLAKEYLNG
jgi:hypothetical protein